MPLFSPTSRSRVSQIEQPTLTTMADESLDIPVASPQVPAHVSEVSIEDDYEDIGPPLPAGVEPIYQRQTNPDTVSRASSIISTGTKMSYRTLPQPGMREAPSHSTTQTHSGPIDIVLGRRNFRITARPGSILSISSFDHHPQSEYPAPPYEANAPAAESNATLVQHSTQGHLDNEDNSELSASNDLQSIESVSLPQPTPRRAQHGALISDIQSESIDPPSRPPSPPSPPLSPATTSANAISAHYTHVVRTIDTNHRAEIERLMAAHAIELSQTRNSIDAAYRAEFSQIRRTSGTQIASLSAQVQELETLLQSTLSANSAERASAAGERATENARTNTEHERRIEQLRADLVAERDEAVRKARNEVEDVWEGRWRDRMRLAGQEVNAAWEERKRITGCWEEEIKRRFPDLVDEIRGTVDVRLKRERAGERRRSGSGNGQY